MKTHKLARLTALAVVLLFVVSWSPRPTAAVAPETDVIPGQYIVAVRTGVSPLVVAVRNGITPLQIYTLVLNGFSAQLSDAQATALQTDPDVNSVLPDQRVEHAPAEESIGVSTAAATATNVPTGVNRIDAEQAKLGKKSDQTNIAVLDTGVGPHNDLRVVRRVDCTKPGCPPGGVDGNGHGTHVAGSAAAKANGGVRGVAPGANISSVKVLGDDNSGTISDLIAGLEVVAVWKQSLGGQWIANMSLTASGREVDECSRPKGSRIKDALHEAVCNAARAGIVMTAAAGNTTEDARRLVPAAYDEVITVSNIADYDGKGGHLAPPNPSCDRGPDDTLANNSNFGKDVDIAAPGVCILSTWLNNTYHSLNGTSMATAHVSGAVALKMASGGLTVNASSEALAARNAAMAALGKVAQDDSVPYEPCSFTETVDKFEEPMVYVGQPNASCQ